MENERALNRTAIESLIYEIRGQKVMLDRDLAKMYGVETKVLNQAVKRNMKRFPEDFMFQLTPEECLRSQIVTLNTKQGQHLKYMPHAFTEQGVAISGNCGSVRQRTSAERTAETKDRIQDTKQQITLWKTAH